MKKEKIRISSNRLTNVDFTEKLKKSQCKSKKFSDAGIQDVSTSISITVKFEKMTDDDNDDKDESDKHLEARDRRYSCLKFTVT